MAKYDEMANTVSLDRVLELGDDMSLPEDIPIMESSDINDKTGSQSFYDCIMEGFILRILKIEELETCIGLRGESHQNMDDAFFFTI